MMPITSGVLTAALVAAYGRNAARDEWTRYKGELRESQPNKLERAITLSQNLVYRGIVFDHKTLRYHIHERMFHRQGLLDYWNEILASDKYCKFVEGVYERDIDLLTLLSRVKSDPIQNRTLDTEFKGFCCLFVNHVENLGFWDLRELIIRSVQRYQDWDFEFAKEFRL